MKKTSGFWFKDGRGGWHHTDTKPKGRTVTVFTTIKIPRTIQVKQVLTAKQYVSQHG